MTMITKGDRVRLDKDGSEQHEGEVIEVTNAADVRIEWDIGVESIYHKYELELAEENDE